MGPDKYKQGHYDILGNSTSTCPGTPAPEMDLNTVLTASVQAKDNAFIPSLTGIKITVNEQMNPNDCTLVVGTEYYKRLRQAIEDQDENSKTET